MKKQTKRDLIYLARFILTGIIITLLFVAAMTALSILVKYVFSPALDRLLWGAWESVNSWL